MCWQDQPFKHEFELKKNEMVAIPQHDTLFRPKIKPLLPTLSNIGLKKYFLKKCQLIINRTRRAILL